MPSPRLLLLVTALAACSPATRVAGRCPSLVPQLADFTAGGVALAVGVDAYNDRDNATAAVAVASAMAIWVAAGVATEGTCARW